jgi:polar amino acid transport system ATP-binding protein
MELELTNVSKRFDDALVIDRVDQSVEGVRSLVLIGPSGGGKSTLLRLIAGLLLPNEGTLRLNGADVPKEEAALRQYRARLGVVFQSFNLFPHLTAEENVVLPLRVVHGQPSADSKEAARALLERFHLSDHQEKRPYELSGGQRQRVAIARALAHRPQLLLLDEPTSALDPEMTGEVLDVVRELKDEGVDFVMATHEMGFARQVADEIWFVAEGKIRETGSAASLFENPKEAQTKRFLERVLKY